MSEKQMQLKKEYVVELSERLSADRRRLVEIKVKLPPAPNRGSRIKILTENVLEYLEAEGYRVLSWDRVSSLTNAKAGSEVGDWVACVSTDPRTVSLSTAVTIANENFDRVEKSLEREVIREASSAASWETEESSLKAPARRTKKVANG